MPHSPWNLFVAFDAEPGTWPSRRRQQPKRNVEYEVLDNRQLLSTLVPAGAGFSVPSASVVNNATAILEKVAPKAFAQFQSALAKAEEQSHADPADVTALAQDEAVVDQDITSAGASGLNDVQDWVDNAFTYGAAGIRDVRRNLVPLSEVSSRLDRSVGGAPAVFDASSPGGSTSPIEQLVVQIQTVAREAKLTPATQSALNRSYSAINKALGPHPYVSLGPGASNVRDPLVVYYDAQVTNFVT